MCPRVSGANDVANAFATAVASKSLTMRQATVAAAIFEFAGAVLVGARVASTIKNGIVPANIFDGNAGLQLLSFVNAIFVSSVWLTIATKMGWPVSTTYSIVSAIAGVGIAVGGFDAPNWGWAGGKGLGAIFGGLVLAPAMAAAFASVVYLMVKYVVLVRANPTRWALLTGPFWFMVVACVCTMSIVYKGAPSLGLDDMSPGKTAAAILLTGFVVGLLAAVFWLPFVYGKVIKKDYSESPACPSV
jgi:sodium-dependent phosphate transporter